MPSSANVTTKLLVLDPAVEVIVCPTFDERLTRYHIEQDAVEPIECHNSEQPSGYSSYTRSAASGGGHTLLAHVDPSQRVNSELECANTSG